MKVERILYILCLLMERSRSVDQIIDALSQEYQFDWRPYSKETIYRDIKQLRDAGFIIHYSKKLGKYELKSIPICLKFEPGEIVALAVACRSIPEKAGLPYAKELSGALEKISNLLSPESKGKLSANPHFQLKLQSLVDYGPHQATIETIRKAIMAGKEIEIVYYSTKSDKEQRRVVDPYELYFSEGGVRLEGYCHLKNKVLEFRVDRIRKLRILPSTIDSLIDCDKFTFKLWLDPKLTRSIGERFLDQRIELNDDGSSILTAHATNPFRLILQILSYGEHAKLLEPARLKEEMALTARQMAKLYEDK